MKLYTEEQMRKIYDLAFINLDHDGSYIIDGNKYFQDKINELTPIELPSDEVTNKTIRNYNINDFGQAAAFIAGAKWMKEQILNQNK